MAHVTKEMKAERARIITPLLKANCLKGSLSVHNGTALVLTITAGPIDFFESANRMNAARAFRRGEAARTVSGDMQVNVYYIQDNFDGLAAEFLSAAVCALKGHDYYDNTDIQSDRFDTSHYIEINIGKWNKPYNLTST